MSWTVFLTPTANRLLHAVRTSEVGTYRKVLKKIEGLAVSPEKQGRALLGPLKGLRRIVAASRYRVIYRVVDQAVVVHVLAVGARREGDTRDIYEIAQKLLRAKLL